MSQLLGELRRLWLCSKKLLATVWREHPLLLVSNAALVVLIALLPFALAYLTGQLINALTADPGRLSADGRASLVLLITGGALFAVLTQLQQFSALKLSKQLWNSFAVSITQTISRLGISLHEDPGNQNTFQKISENAPTRVPFYVERIFFLAQNILELTLAAVVLAAGSGLVAALLVAGWIPRMILELWYGRAIYDLEGRLAPLRRKYWWGRWALINVDSLVEIKVSGNVGHFIEQLRDCRASIMDQEMLVERKNLRHQLLALLLAQAASSGAIVFFLMQLLRGNLELGTFAFYLSSIAALSTATANFSRNLGRQFQDGMFVQEMFELFDRAAASSPKPPAVELGDSVPNIEFRDVVAAYDGKPSPILSDINLTIKPGSSLGIVGVNEAGKTTLIKFLCGFYRPRSGKILIDGVDLADLDLEHQWWPRLGLLLQGFWDYPYMTAKEAIAIGRRRSNQPPDMERIMRAARRADIHDSIQNLPKKYDTPLSPWFGGVKLSGGANQKIGLARVEYRDPQVVILDEPTSAVDGEAEQRIFDRLIRQNDGRTKILISHRYYTLRHADQIIVLDNGRIVERGSHDELMAAKGIYAERFRRQAAAYWSDAPHTKVA